MARLRGVSARAGGPAVTLAESLTRRQSARLAGRTPERLLEPLASDALVLGLLRGDAGCAGVLGDQRRPIVRCSVRLIVPGERLLVPTTVNDTGGAAVVLAA